jgi:hypothetical protein
MLAKFDAKLVVFWADRTPFDLPSIAALDEP